MIDEEIIEPEDEQVEETAEETEPVGPSQEDQDAQAIAHLMKRNMWPPQPAHAPQQRQESQGEEFDEWEKPLADKIARQVQSQMIESNRSIIQQQFVSEAVASLEEAGVTVDAATRAEMAQMARQTPPNELHAVLNSGAVKPLIWGHFGPKFVGKASRPAPVGKASERVEATATVVDRGVYTRDQLNEIEKFKSAFKFTDAEAKELLRKDGRI